MHVQKKTSSIALTNGETNGPYVVMGGEYTEGDPFIAE